MGRLPNGVELLHFVPIVERQVLSGRILKYLRSAKLLLFRTRGSNPSFSSHDKLPYRRLPLREGWVTRVCPVGASKAAEVILARPLSC